MLVVLGGFGVILSLWREAEANEARAREGERNAQDQMHRAQAAQQEAEESRARTLGLMVQVRQVAEKIRPRAADQGLAVEILRTVESRCQLLLRKRPAD